MRIVVALAALSAAACAHASEPAHGPAKPPTIDAGHAGHAVSEGDPVSADYAPPGANDPAPPPLTAVLAPGTGAISGIVRDEKGAGIAGVTVVAARPGVEGELSEITDERGWYVLIGPPGTYEVDFYYSELKLVRTRVPVTEQTVTPLDLRIDTAKIGDEIRVE